MMKAEEQIYFKIPKKLKDEFISIINENDTTVSQTIRELIRCYVNDRRNDVTKEYSLV